MSRFTKNLGLGDGAISIDYSNSPPTLSVNLGYFAKDGRRWILKDKDVELLMEMVNSYIDDLTNPPPNSIDNYDFEGEEETFQKLSQQEPLPEDECDRMDCGGVHTPSKKTLEAMKEADEMVKRHNLLNGAIEEMAIPPRDYEACRGNILPEELSGETKSLADQLKSTVDTLVKYPVKYPDSVEG